MNTRDSQHRDDAVVTTVTGAVCALGLAGALSPVVEHAVTLALLVIAALTVAVLAARWLARRLREHREDRADTLTAIAWRSANLPADHPLVVRDRFTAGTRADAARRGRRARVGVA